MQGGGAVEFVLRARDEATGVVRGLTSELLNLKGGLVQTIAQFGPYGKAAATLIGIASSVGAANIKMADTVEKLEQTSRRLGVTIEQYQLLKMTMEDAGAGSSSLTLAMQRMNKAIEDGNETLKDLGIETRDTYETFRLFLRALNQEEDQAKRTAMALSVFGRGAGDLIGAIEPMAEMMDKTAERAEKFETIIGEDMIEQFRDLNDALDDLKAAWAGLMLALGRDGIEATASMIRAFASMLSLLREMKQAASEFFGSFVNMAVYVGKFLSNPAGFINQAVTRTAASAQGVQLDANLRPVTTPPPRRPPPPPPPPEPSAAQLVIASVLQYARITSAGATSGTALGLRGVEAADQSREGWRKRLEDLGKRLEEVTEPAMALSDAMLLMQQRIEATNRASAIIVESAQRSIANNFSSTIRTLIIGTEKISDVFRNMVNSILTDIATAAAQQGIGLGLMAIGTAIGGPIGGFIGGVGGKLASGMTATNNPGGDTFVIQTINAKDVVQSILSPTGSMRNANDRVRELAVVY